MIIQDDGCKSLFLRLKIIFFGG